MSFTNAHLAEEALARLLTDSLASDSHTDAEIKSMLRARLENLKSGRDRGMTFEEVFGEKPKSG